MGEDLTCKYNIDNFANKHESNSEKVGLLNSIAQSTSTSKCSCSLCATTVDNNLKPVTTGHPVDVTNSPLDKDIKIICTLTAAAASQMIRDQSYVTKPKETGHGLLKRFLCCNRFEMESKPLDDESYESLRTTSINQESVKDNPLLIRKFSKNGRKMSVSERSELDRAIVYETLRNYSLKSILDETF